MGEENQNRDKQQDSQWHGAVLDDKGREQPITEHMIARACVELDESYSIGVSRQNPALEDH